ncbi:unnamed protein product, partial [Dibothriocephalus latus]
MDFVSPGLRRQNVITNAQAEILPPNDVPSFYPSDGHLPSILSSPGNYEGSAFEASSTLPSHRYSFHSPFRESGPNSRP